MTSNQPLETTLLTTQIEHLLKNLWLNKLNDVEGQFNQS